MSQIDKGQAFLTSLSLSRGLNWVSIDSAEHSSVFQRSHPKHWHVMRLRGNEVSPLRWRLKQKMCLQKCLSVHLAFRFCAWCGLDRGLADPLVELGKAQS